MADAIRLALLLPHTSTHIEEYVPWTGGQNPVVELTFETEAQRIWRVRKEFRKGGASMLRGIEERCGLRRRRARSKGGCEASGDPALGHPGAGRRGGSKGLPSSFLATALLSTQADVTAVLSESLSDDPTGSGKERIAAALQAVAQDPLFVALTQRDPGADGIRPTPKRVPRRLPREACSRKPLTGSGKCENEKERLQKLVDDSEGVEKQLRELTATRSQHEEAVASATERVKTLEQLAAQAAALFPLRPSKFASRARKSSGSWGSIATLARSETSKTSPSKWLKLRRH